MVNRTGLLYPKIGEAMLDYHVLQAEKRQEDMGHHANEIENDYYRWIRSYRDYNLYDAAADINDERLYDLMDYEAGYEIAAKRFKRTKAIDFFDSNEDVMREIHENMYTEDEHARD